MKRILLCLVLALFASPFLQASESGPDNGTIYVKVLFADAQYDVSRSLIPLSDKDVATLEISPEIKKWLLVRSQNKSRFDYMKYYLRKMDLKFQKAPCSDGTGKPASICFFNDAANGPYVLISLDENRMTTKNQAIAMLIHEAGHFTGERDHLFLDKAGVQLAAALKNPSVLIADAQSTEIVPNIFLAKQECEAGTSQQARILRQQAQADLLVQCSNRKIKCNAGRATFIHQGTTRFENGGGFDMKVTCAVKAILKLR